MEQTTGFTREVIQALGAAFPDEEIEFLPRATSGGNAMALAYIDARDVMRRLDAVVGPENWSFDFDVLSGDGKMVRGRLTVLGVTKCDAGESGGEDEPLKSAVSDALKRCAVHFGIGRYLYYLPRVWAPFDAQKRRFIETPRLDPAGVRRALAICGITPAAPSRPAPEPRKAEPEAPRQGNRVAEPTPVREEPRVEAREEPREESAERAKNGKSIWTAGANGAHEAPESAGDRAATRSARPAAPAPAPNAEAAPASLVCSNGDCSKPLTKGQHDVSVRAYGQPLCPACQKQHARMNA